MPVRYLTDEEIIEARKGVPTSPNILLNEPAVEGNPDIPPPKPSRYTELKRELEESKKRQQRERDAALGIANPLEEQAKLLDTTSDNIDTAASQRQFGQLANMASIGMDQASQFSDKKFDNSESRKLNTDISENYAKSMGARQALADKLRARAEENRLRPALENTKYATAEALELKNLTDQASNPIELANRQSNADINERKNRMGEETYRSDVDTSLLKNDADMSKSRNVLYSEDNVNKTSDENLNQERLQTKSMGLQNEGTSISNQDRTLTLNQNKSNADPTNMTNQLVKSNLASELLAQASQETDPARKEELFRISDALKGDNMTRADIDYLQKQFPGLSLKAALQKDKFENKKETTDAKAARGKDLVTAEVDDIKGLNSTIETLDVIKEMKKNIDTGKVENVLADAKAKFGIDAPDMRQFKQRLTGMLARYMNSISGAAVNEGELKRLTLAIPTADLPDKQFMAALEAFREDLVRERKVTLTTLKESKRDVSGHDINKYGGSKTTERVWNDEEKEALKWLEGQDPNSEKAKAVRKSLGV